ncbi:MAG: HAMP domain-containing protein [Bryobacterales bacterium]|nr:HAMP domain-containing protein [Bryobacterales bacterium]
MSYRLKLQVAFLLLGLTAVGITGWEASLTATAALSQATYGRLTAVRQTRLRQIERYFEDLRNHVLALSTDESTIASLEEFDRAWPQLAPASSAQPLRAHYAAHHPLEQSVWFPSDPRTLALQHHYIAANNHPLGSKDLLLSAPAAGAYDRTHLRYHPTLHRSQSAFGFYDIFLINAEGLVLYTVFKEIDFGVNLRAAPYNATSLAKVFEKAIALQETEQTAIEDFAFYAPSHQAPASFLAAPIWRRGDAIGVLAIQVSINEINRVMTANRNWREEGLGETGQAYIVGPDGALRSDMRVELERPDEYFNRLRQNGIAEEPIRLMRRHRTTVLNLRAPPEVVARIKTHTPGTQPGKREGGVPVLRSDAPLTVPGLDWWLTAEIDSAEAFAPIADLRWRMQLYAIGIALVLILAAGWLGRSVTQPVLALAAGARRFGAHDFNVRIPASSKDEIGALADSFNAMAADLQRTTVSREQLHGILESLLNAVVVVDAPRTATPRNLLDAHITFANPAAAGLLGGKLLGSPLRTILPQEDESDRSLWRPLLEDGRLPAVETLLKPAGKDPVPVLLTAAFVSGHDAGAGAVIAAHDITERKLAETALRQKQRELERLTGRLLAAQEEERSRLARELHDDLTQRLAAVAIEAGNAGRLPPQERAASLDRIKEQMARLSQDVHGLSRRLHPSTLDDLGLVAAIESECRVFFDRGGAPVDFHHQGDFAGLSKDAQLTLFRIVQESLRNIRKHADATEVAIRLEGAPAAVTLEIGDNGRGFARTQPGWRAGVGLASMEERARLLDGSFHLSTSPGRGTRITVILPLEIAA